MITTENRTLLIQILRKLNTSQQELDNGGLPEGLTFPLKLLRDVRDLEALLQNFEKEKLLVSFCVFHGKMLETFKELISIRKQITKNVQIQCFKNRKKDNFVFFSID